jgi:subtilisin-like proprotein convertase family protein
MLRKGIGIAAIMVLVALVGVAAAATKTRTFSSGAISKGFGSGDAVTQSLKVKPKGKIKDVNLGVALTTNENDDFTFLVQAPNGKVVHLSSGNGGSGSGYGSDCSANEITTFDDEGAQDIQDYEGVDHVFDGGSYAPEQWDDVSESGGLSVLDGSKLNGTWRLIAIHTEDIGVGSLKCFKVKAKYKAS